MPFYRNILQQAWLLTWRNKYLWWFGTFAALLGSGGEFEILFNNTGSNPSQALFPAWQKIASTGLFSKATLLNIGNLLQNDTLSLALVLIMGLIILAVFLFIIWLVVISQAAIVNNSAALIKQKKLTLRNGLGSGMMNFWPVFVLNLLVKIAVYVLLAAISLPVIFYQASSNAKLFYILALIVAVPIIIILSFIMKYAIAYVVVNKTNLGRAIKQSWLLFKENWLVSFEMAVILFFINLLVGLALVLGILTLAVPFLFLGMIFYYGFGAVGSWLIAALGFLTFIFIIVVCGAGLSVFQISSWTGLFLELDKNGGTPKIVRLVNSVIKP